MIYREIEGDLIKLAKIDEFDIIGHGCNCKKNWGKGIALSMKKAYPLAYEIDKNSNPNLGEYSVCTDYDITILNIYSQLYPGKARKNYDSEFKRYEAINNVMILINEEFSGKHIGLPMIGSGLAGLKWQKIKKSIKNNLTDLDITIVRYNKNIKY